MLSQLIVSIHSFVQDTDNVDSFGYCEIEDQMLAGGKYAQLLVKFISAFSQSGIFR